MLMPRRHTVTLAVSGALLAAFGVGVYAQPVPYAEMTPGPTFDTLGSYQGTPLITVSGHQTYNTTGQLRMVTVGVSSQDYQMPLGTALIGWLSSDQAIVPKETIYPPGTTQQQSDQENAVAFTDSQDAAITAALAALGIKPTGSEVVIASVTAGTPANDKLQPGDIIKSIDGTPITAGGDGDAGLNEVQAAVQKVTPGQQVTFEVSRAGKDQTVTTSTVKNSQGKAAVGIAVQTESTFPFNVDIQLNGVGGPSAGMMFALGIIDKLTAGGDLTDGKVIAGTGTIDASGNVGAIGGIQMKTIGARRDGATVFLAPADNCADAKANLPSGLELVKVSTLQDALNALTDIREGKTPPSC
ncbi:MAG TPA: PDZ domain-containing protein [Actinocrinis sp.]|nr:PDZ domain-containing protein [Actinocrinis sp.]